MSESESNNNAWLGLLKWSLNYVDGTVPSTESQGFREMSKEDRAFLEEVMKNGIIDEGERMKTILSSLVAYLDVILDLDVHDEKDEKDEKDDDDDEKKNKDDTTTVVSDDEALALLEELQFIVEQIDYAKSFAAMGGIEFLIGFSAQKTEVSKSIRSACLTALSTLCQNNPPVQYMMLEHGAILKLLQLYSGEFPERGDANADSADADSSIDSVDKRDTSLRAKIMQVMSSFVRNHDTAEKIYCMNADGIQMIESGLGIHSTNETLPRPDVQLKRKTLFFLQALVTSDSADAERMRLFTRPIQYSACNFLDPDIDGDKNGDGQGQGQDQELREMTLSMLCRILDRKCCVNPVLDMKPTLVGLGVKRVTTLRAMDGEDRDYAEEELRLWESLITDIARSSRDEERAI